MHLGIPYVGSLLLKVLPTITHHWINIEATEDLFLQVLDGNSVPKVLKSILIFFSLPRKTSNILLKELKAPGILSHQEKKKGKKKTVKNPRNSFREKLFFLPDSELTSFLLHEKKAEDLLFS
jgi:hypothetical protein